MLLQRHCFYKKEWETKGLFWSSMYIIIITWKLYLQSCLYPLCPWQKLFRIRMVVNMVDDVIIYISKQQRNLIDTILLKHLMYNMCAIPTCWSVAGIIRESATNFTHCWDVPTIKNSVLSLFSFNKFLFILLLMSDIDFWSWIIDENWSFTKFGDAYK